MSSTYELLWLILRSRYIKHHFAVKETCFLLQLLTFYQDKAPFLCLSCSDTEEVMTLFGRLVRMLVLLNMSGPPQHLHSHQIHNGVNKVRPAEELRDIVPSIPHHSSWLRTQGNKTWFSFLRTIVLLLIVFSSITKKYFFIVKTVLHACRLYILLNMQMPTGPCVYLCAGHVVQCVYVRVKWCGSDGSVHFADTVTQERLSEGRGRIRALQSSARF